MFTVGLVHARDHSQGCSVAGVQNRPQGVHEGLIGCPFLGWYQEGGSQRSPWSPGGPQVESKVLVAQHTSVNTNIY